MDLSLILLILLALLVLVIIYFVTIYNRLQSLRNGAEATLSQIRVAMKKRLDMVEQLVELTKAMPISSGTFWKRSRACVQALGAPARLI
jgi:hypothetical protein